MRSKYVRGAGYIVGASLLSMKIADIAVDATMKLCYKDDRYRRMLINMTMR